MNRRMIGRGLAAVLGLTLPLTMATAPAADAEVAFTAWVKSCKNEFGATDVSKQCAQLFVSVYDNGDIHITKLITTATQNPGACNSGTYASTAPAIRNNGQNIDAEQNNGSNLNTVWHIEDPVGNLNFGNNCSITRVFDPDVVVHQERLVFIWTYYVRWAAGQGGGSTFGAVSITIWHPNGQQVAINHSCGEDAFSCTSG